MQPFPNLYVNEVVLLRASFAPGHLLDNTFEVSLTHDQHVYTVFRNLEQAEAYVKEIQSQHIDVEFCIYDKHQTCVKYIPPRSETV
jgi:hypothetical protein